MRQHPIKDNRRTDPRTPVGYVCMTDKFLSGWGRASGRSLYAVAIYEDDDPQVVLDNAKHRSEMVRVRYQLNLPHLQDGDHLAVVDRGVASRWYEPGMWK